MVGVVGATWSKRGIQAEPWTLRLIDAGTVGFNAPLIVLCPPVVNDRFDSVSAGPSTYPFTGADEAGSCRLTNAFLTTEKSRLLPITTAPPAVVEPAFVEDKKSGATDSGVSTCNRPLAGTASNDVKLNVMYVVEVVGAAPFVTGTKMSLPTSKVLLLVQYVSRGASRSQ